MRPENIPIFILRYANLHHEVKVSTVKNKIAPELDMNAAQARVFLDDLVSRGMLSMDKPGHVCVYHITSIGRRYLVDLGVNQ